MRRAIHLDIVPNTFVLFIEDAAILLLGSQTTLILKFFLSRNIRIARDRAWDYTVASRGKGPEFWQPYVEEWEQPPVVDESRTATFRKLLNGWAETMVGTMVVKSA